MEAGFFKWSSASFLFIPFLCFFTEENESVGRKTYSECNKVKESHI